MGRQKRDYSEAFAEIESGHTVRSVAVRRGVPYQTLYLAVRRAGISGGRLQRDRRPLKEKIKERMEWVGECIRWKGGSARLAANVQTPRQCVRHFLGVTSPGRYGFRGAPMCGNQWCLNPEHSKRERHFDRNEEIRERWRNHLRYKTSMRKLAEEYGITKQRIEQIIGK